MNFTISLSLIVVPQFYESHLNYVWVDNNFMSPTWTMYGVDNNFMSPTWTMYGADNSFMSPTWTMYGADNARILWALW